MIWRVTIRVRDLRGCRPLTLLSGPASMSSAKLQDSKGWRCAWDHRTIVTHDGPMTLATKAPLSSTKDARDRFHDCRIPMNHSTVVGVVGRGLADARNRSTPSREAPWPRSDACTISHRFLLKRRDHVLPVFLTGARRPHAWIAATIATASLIASNGNF